MADNIEQCDQMGNDQETMGGDKDIADTLVDFLPIDKQTLSDFEADRLKKLISQRSPYRTTD